MANLHGVSPVCATEKGMQRRMRRLLDLGSESWLPLLRLLIGIFYIDKYSGKKYRFYSKLFVGSLTTKVPPAVAPGLLLFSYESADGDGSGRLRRRQ
jgi:hypothetical protein